MMELRIMERVLPEPNSGCWLWMGRGHSQGYGRLGESFAHRLSYETFKGPIPEGLQIDHLCRVRLCVNPAHLEAVEWHENWRRGESTSAKQSRQQECVRGHSLTGTNLVSNSRGTRQCRICHNDRRRSARHKKRGACQAS